MDQLTWLQCYYLSCCNGDWEHTYGIKIDTLDNPGWVLTIDLEDTILEDIPFNELRWNNNAQDWGRCIVFSKIFKAHGGPKNLSDLITIFRNWVEERDTDGMIK